MASSLEFNKLVAGVLTAGIIASGAGLLASLLYRSPDLEEHAFMVDVDDAADADAADAEAAGPAPIAVRLASADAGAGEGITRQCTACHVFDEGGANRVGPVLWDVVGRDIAAVDGFNYSGALAGLDGEWTFESLDGFLAAPREWAPGTSMSYAGLRDAGDRANLIAYLQSLSNDPVPLPEPEEETVEAEEPAEAETAAAEEAEAPAEEEAAAAEEAESPAEEEAAAAEEATEEPAEEEAAATEEAAEEPAAEETAAAEEATEEPVEEEAAAASEASGMVAMVADADPAEGQRLFRQCAACHTADQGGPNRVGPNLWDVFGADVGHHEGFNYSNALLSIEGVWTVDKLDHYLENPREFAPGNRMAFAGVRSEADRAALIAYLHSLSNDPKPLDVE